MEAKRQTKPHAVSGYRTLGQLVLALGKCIIAMMTGSKALLADAVHTASSAAYFFCQGLANNAEKAATNEPYFEINRNSRAIAGIISAALFILLGLQLIVYQAIAFFGETPATPPVYLIPVIVFLIAAKELLVYFENRSGSEAMTASSNSGKKHRMDLLCSLLVLIGVGFSVLGEFSGVTLLYYADPLAGIIVSGLLIYRGCIFLIEHVLKQTVALSDDQIIVYRQTIESIPGVMQLIAVEARKDGERMNVTVEISVNPMISVTDGHLIGKAVNKRLRQNHRELSRIAIVIVPFSHAFKDASTALPETMKMMH